MNNILDIKLNSVEVKRLCDSDKILCRLINILGQYKLTLDTNYFDSLVCSIIGQQLSIKAANTIINRLRNICDFNPQVILSTPDEVFRGIGVSGSKMKYMKDLSSKVAENTLDFNQIINLSDDELIDELTKVKGIGKWTAEMFLIFSLGRINILPKGDAGIIRAIKWLYSL